MGWWCSSGLDLMSVQNGIWEECLPGFTQFKDFKLEQITLNFLQRQKCTLKPWYQSWRSILEQNNIQKDVLLCYRSRTNMDFMELTSLIWRPSEICGIISILIVPNIMLIGLKIFINVIGKELISGSMISQLMIKKKKWENSKKKARYLEDKFILGGWLTGLRSGEVRK